MVGTSKSILQVGKKTELSLAMNAEKAKLSATLAFPPSFQLFCRLQAGCPANRAEFEIDSGVIAAITGLPQLSSLHSFTTPRFLRISPC
jgi:hypothetical protein